MIRMYHRTCVDAYYKIGPLNQELDLLRISQKINSSNSLKSYEHGYFLPLTQLKLGISGVLQLTVGCDDKMKLVC